MTNENNELRVGDVLKEEEGDFIDLSTEVSEKEEDKKEGVNLSDILGSSLEPTVEAEVYLGEVKDLQEERKQEEEEQEEQEELVSEKTVELKKKTEEYKEMLGNVDLQSTVDFSLQNRDGEYISPRNYNGSTYLKVLNIESDIKTPRRVRKSTQSLFNLQEQLRKFGQLQPIHVVEWGDYYLLVDGMRRVQASINLGKTEILAYVDGTVPEELVKYYEAVVNSKEPYLFSEKLEYGEKFYREQPNVGYDVIEGILGMESGEFLKGLYINELKADFSDIYTQVEKGKITIDQGFKKIEKEIDKQAKEEAKAEEELQSEDMDGLKNVNELTDMANDANVQELGNRKILDPVLRRSIESRDKGYCQCCGFGKNEPDLMGVFHVHHIIAVQYGGADAKSNLILLCNNCHTLVHDYETGRFMPEESTYNRLSWVKRVIVLGNMLQIIRKKGIAEIRSKHPDTARVLDAGKTTIGKALHKHNIYLGGEEYFGGSPYQTFLDSTQDLEYGGEVQGELGELSWVEEEVEETVEELDKDDIEVSEEDFKEDELTDDN